MRERRQWSDFGSFVARSAIWLLAAGVVGGCGAAAPPRSDPCAPAMGTGLPAAGPTAAAASHSPSAPAPFCEPAERPHTPAAPGAPAAASSSAERPELRIALRPAALPSPTIHVAVELRSARAADARSWSFSPREDGTPAGLAVVGDEGPLAHGFGCASGRCTLTLSEEARGPVRIRYQITPATEQAGETLGVVLATDHFYAAAERLLLLPDALDEQSVRAQLRFDLNPEEMAVSASSLGVGRCQDEVVAGRLLRQMSLLAGPLGTSLLDAYEGHDEAAWSGYTAFDMRSFAAEIAETRSAIGQFFGDKGSAPSTLLVVAHRRPRENVAVALRAGGLVGFLAVDERWSGPLRLAFAQQLLHHWIGGQLWIGPADAAHEAESWWFTDGFARHYARVLLTRFGVLSSTEARDELNALAAVQATTELRTLSNAALAARAADPKARSLLVARGALYAARVDALVRARSGGKRSLDDLTRELYRRSKAARGALPHAAWRDALTAELGATEADTLDRLLLGGGAIELPRDALGPCLRPAQQRHAIFGLGFDLAATRRASPSVLVGLDRQGPAARAGARDGDLLEEVHYEDKRVDLPVRLVVRRGAEQRTIEYAPITATVPFMGWERVPKVPEESCAK